jgi:hypothetical protein
VNDRIESADVTLAPVNGLAVLPPTCDDIHVTTDSPVVVLKIVDVPGARLAAIVTDLFCVTPATSSVVADALLAPAITIRAIVVAERPAVFRYLIGSPSYS